LASEQRVPATDRAASERRAAGQSTARLSEATILVVEDNDETRQLVRIFLKAADRVVGVASSAEALQSLEDEVFDGVLLDINLGEERTGLELIDEIRTISDYQNVPIVAFTAYALPGDEERFMQAGFDGYVQKPFTKRQLLRTLNQVLASGTLRTSPSSHSPG
jgi:CheY-like chemotaxis protein